MACTFRSVVGLVALAAAVVACDDGSSGGGSGGGTGSPGSGGSGEPSAEPKPSTFVTDGRGTSGTWDGYLFTVAEDGSSISPAEFGPATGEFVCVSGTLGAAYEEWALVGWNIAQEIDPETFEGGAVNAVPPGGSGVQVEVQNFAGVGGQGLRVQIQSDDTGTESWCADVPASGSGVIEWGAFTKECWETGGEPYDGTTPLAQVAVQVYSPSDSVESEFDYCVVNLAPAP